jgi:hypothetical protein
MHNTDHVHYVARGRPVPRAGAPGRLDGGGERGRCTLCASGRYFPRKGVNLPGFACVSARRRLEDGRYGPPGVTLTPAFTEGAGLVEVVRRHSGPLVRFARRLVGSTEDAEEIVQEALLRAYANRLRRARRGSSRTRSTRSRVTSPSTTFAGSGCASSSRAPSSRGPTPTSRAPRRRLS